MGKKVYLVMIKDHGYNGVLSVASSRDKAKEMVDIYEYRYCFSREQKVHIKEYDLDETP